MGLIFSPQVKAVIIHRVMPRLGFHPYIRQFAMPAGCILPPDSDELVHIGIDDTEDLINCVVVRDVRFGAANRTDKRSERVN
jgi:hypothetical protein